jgi:DNA-binding transcriptional MerR regulator
MWVSKSGSFLKTRAVVLLLLTRSNVLQIQRRPVPPVLTDIPIPVPVPGGCAMTRPASSSVPSQESPSAEYRRKLFYRIQEVAEIAGLKPYVLRYWETEFEELAPEKDKNDQRRYRQADIDLILRIKDLLYNKKYTIAGARQQIRTERAAASPGAKRGTHDRRSALRGIRAELSDLLNQLGA